MWVCVQSYTLGQISCTWGPYDEDTRCRHPSDEVEDSPLERRTGGLIAGAWMSSAGL